MDTGNFVLLLSKLLFGAMATFLAILVWSKTRDTAWMLVIVGTIFRYAEVMHSTLAIFGILPEEIFVLHSIPVVQVALANFPSLFYSAAFLIVLVRSFRR
jgi:hypothetical protein